MDTLYIHTFEGRVWEVTSRGGHHKDSSAVVKASKKALELRYANDHIAMVVILITKYIDNPHKYLSICMKVNFMCAVKFRIE